MKNPTTDKLAYDLDGEELHGDREESVLYIPIMRYVEPAAVMPPIDSERMSYLSPELKRLRDAEQERFEFAEAA